MDELQDRTLTCADWGGEFIFSEGEQKFYNQKKFHDPKRCKSCRKERKNKFHGNRERD